MRTRFLHVHRDCGHEIECTRPIVDVEITDPTHGWDEYELRKMDICCVGIIVDDQIIQIHREPSVNDIAQFKRETISHIERYPLMHAFARDFEYHGLRGYLDLGSFEIAEIQPFKGKGWNKEKFFGELVTDGIVRTPMPIDPLDGNGALVPRCWANGDIRSILDHNVCCLLKEHYILEHRDHLYRKHSHRINDDGWYQQEWYSDDRDEEDEEEDSESDASSYIF
jgi:hypothetical protein